MAISMTPAAAFLTNVDVAGKTVIDVGCGAGSLIRELRQRGARGIGLECGAGMRAKAVAADPAHADDYIDAGGESLPLPDAFADVIVYSLSLHHVPTPLRIAAIQEARRVLGPGGVLCIMEPVPEGPGHIVFAPIADETVVCGEVQALLDKVPSFGFAPSASTTFVTEWIYADAAAAIADAVGIDPDRQTIQAARSPEVHALFEQYGVATSQGVALSQPVKLDLFTAV